MQINLEDPQDPKYVNIYVLLLILKKLQKKSNICDNICVTAEVSSLTRLTNDAFRLIEDTSFRLKCLRLRCHDFSALAD